MLLQISTINLFFWKGSLLLNIKEKLTLKNYDNSEKKNKLVSLSKYCGRISFLIPFFKFIARLVERVCLNFLS